MGEIEIRRLRPEEWERYRDLRLRALAEAPYAFSSTLSEEEGLPDEQWREWARGTVLIATEDDRWIGMLGAFPDDDPNVLVVFGMWVDPKLRGSGIGRRLLDEAIDWARAQRARRLRLWVSESNELAVRLYLANGFVATGRRQPLPSDQSLTEIELDREV